ncbi:suppressor of glycerol defect [Rhizophlyctis rosea]|nr:suppressor of glycerol defect [Rhizophlyctis rosea]
MAPQRPQRGGRRNDNSGHRGQMRNGGRRRAANDTTTLPAALAQTLETNRNDDDSIERFAFRGFSKKQLSRKDDRKRKRDEKKQRKQEFFTQKKGSDVPKDVPVAVSEKSTTASSKRKRETDTASPQPLKKQKPSTTSSPASSSASSKTKPAPQPPTTASEARQLAKLAETNPHFYSLLKEQRLISGGPAPTVSVQQAAFEQDDKEIEMYARKLGLNKKKKKTGKDGLTKAFAEDGLDFLFAGLEGTPIEKSLKAKTTAEAGNAEGVSDIEADESLKGLDERDEDEEDAQFDGEEDDEDLDGDDFGMGGRDEDEDEDEIDEFGLAEEDSDLTDADSDEEAAEDDEGEDVDDDDLDMSEGEGGNGEDEDGDAQPSTAAPPEADTAPATKYIPPHLRAKPTTQSEQYLRLKRQLQGQLNRLSDANMESIIGAVEECFGRASRHDITEILTDLITTIIADHANLLDSFVMTYAAFIAALYNTIGTEFGAHLVQTIVEMLDTGRNEWLAASKNEGASESKEKELSNKKCVNLVTLLGYLYDFSVVAHIIIYDVIRLSISTLSELDVEILLRLIRISGFQLRSDDPSSLKEIVLSVQEGMAEKEKESVAGGAAVSTRAKFMVETIMDLKNNRRKVVKRSEGQNVQMDRLKKFVGNLSKKRSSIGSNEPLRVSLSDIRSIHTKGKWWLVGAAWAGHGDQDASSAAGGGGGGEGVKDALTASTGDLLKLARAMKMNTDVRRSVFVVLMSSEDCVDCFERLMKLRLKGEQEREIVRVLVHCCAQEKVYNPYYALVAEKLCQHAHGFKITLQFVLWDGVKAMGEAGDEESGDGEAMDVRKVSHYARMYAYLVGRGALTLAVLKALKFTHLTPLQTLFAQLFFTTILTAPTPASKKTQKDPDAGVKAIFERITVGAASEQLENLREGIVFFLQQFVVGKKGDGVVKEGEKEVVRRRVKVVRGVLVGREM